jgi:hypothetical protein
MLSLMAVACGDDDAPGDDVDAGVDADLGPDADPTCPDPLPAPEACDYFLSCGCDTPDEKCSVLVGGANGCVAVGTKTDGMACASDNECVAGTICAKYGDSMVCMRFCDDAHACPSTPNAQACYIGVTNSDAELCGQICDLRTQDCALPDQGCYPSSKAGQMEKGICVKAGTSVEGGPCGPANDCSEGLTCVTVNQVSTCHKLCDRGGGAPTCAMGMCQALAGHTQTGYCP